MYKNYTRTRENGTRTDQSCSRARGKKIEEQKAFTLDLEKNRLESKEKMKK